MELFGELGHGCCPLSWPSGLTGLKDVPSNRQLIESEWASRGVVNYDVVERILILIISDNKVRTQGIPCGESSHIMLLDDEYMAEVKSAYTRSTIWMVFMSIEYSSPDYRPFAA